MKVKDFKNVAIATLLFILALTLLWWQDSRVIGNVERIESFGITYYKPIGGESREVQSVKLNCFIGASKGATDGNLWCQENVMEEWEE